MRVLLHCSDMLNSSMAGPAIRYWELAKALSQFHKVILSIPNLSDLQSDSVLIHSRSQYNLQEDIASSDIIITQIVTPRIAYTAKKNGVRIILDAYDPMPLENLELFKSKTLAMRNYENEMILSQFVFAFQMSDAVICANSRQRDLWIGLLMGLGQITPTKYDHDSGLNSLITIVPFGMPSIPPQKSGDGLRKIFGIKEEDTVLLWGGGIWNWFDPLTLIKAVHLLNNEGNSTKLVFMGIKHPNETVPTMKMAFNAVQMAKELDLLDKSVFFNYGWTPYQQRQNFLLDADIGVSMHFQHLETQYSFRTRMLDYIWSSLPIIATEGDSFADLIRSRNLGIVVPYDDAKAIANAIKHIQKNSNLRKEIKDNLKEISIDFHWDKIAQSLDTMFKALSKQPKERLSCGKFLDMLSFWWSRRSPSAIFNKVKFNKLRRESV